MDVFKFSFSTDTSLLAVLAHSGKWIAIKSSVITSLTGVANEFNKGIGLSSDTKRRHPIDQKTCVLYVRVATQGSVDEGR